MIRIPALRPSAVAIAAPGLLLASIALGIEPRQRFDWALENLLAVLFVAALVLTRRRFRFSDNSYLAIMLFLLVHEVGAHYTYSAVPYDTWTQQLFDRPLGEALGWTRNHFDRLAHFLYGFLLILPVEELARRRARLRRGWRPFCSFNFIMMTAVLYELIEWGAAIVFGAETQTSYLGMQGDVWDAQKDLAIAGVGALLSLALLNANAWLAVMRRVSSSAAGTAGGARPSSRHRPGLQPR